MDENRSEMQDFIKEVQESQPKTLEEALGIQDDVKPKAEVPEKAETSEEEPYKNRKHRRWEARLSDKEKELIAKEARLQALEEVSAERQLEKAGDVDPRLVKIFGTEGPSAEAAALFQQMFSEFKNQAKEEAVSEYLAEREREAEAVGEAESELDSSFEALEDESGVDFTSNAPAARKARTEMLDLLEKFSPKDSDGNILEYADMNGIYEVWQMQRTRPSNTRSKELASRSMESGEVADNSPKPKDPAQFSNWRRWAGIE